MSDRTIPYDETVHHTCIGRMTWAPGQPIQQGKYRIERELGKGAFGVTYLALTQAGQRVVIKTPNEFVRQHALAVKLQQDFLNEALRLARCHHPHVVQVIELVRERRLDGIVMEYIEGHSLEDRLAQGRLSEATALRYIQQMGEALTIVHQQGLLHRDIKPGNIMVRSVKDEAVLIDFGIARDFTPNLTQTHTLMWTPGYAPIEQYDQRLRGGAYTDVYALAATLYVLVTGQRLSESRDRALQQVRYHSDPLAPPKALNPDLSERTNQAILQALAIEPTDRPQSMPEWLSLLAPSPFPSVPLPLSDRYPNAPPAPPPVLRQPFTFQTITVNPRGKVTHRQERQAEFYVEDLGDGVVLEMVMIPAGEFLMGSPETEPGRHACESPQHLVKVPEFCMGKFVVTQVQWVAVSKLPQMERGLSADSSRFKAAQRPIERVAWQEAREFCQRLSQKTGKLYRLPSEAEWEYACRARTKTPFHFGETITTDLANFDGRSTYASALKGDYREQTMEVGRFSANGFGLYDMHGNVWEWCEDHWHEHYSGAPIDGSAWLDRNAAIDARRVSRGGSWVNDPWDCRSAARDDHLTGFGLNYGSFRVVWRSLA